MHQLHISPVSRPIDDATLAILADEIEEMGVTLSAVWDELREPRDERGRWTSGGGRSVDLLSSEPTENVIPSHQSDSLSERRSRWMTTPKQEKKYPAESREALIGKVDAWLHQQNKKLYDPMNEETKSLYRNAFVDVLARMSDNAACMMDENVDKIRFFGTTGLLTASLDIEAYKQGRRAAAGFSHFRPTHYGDLFLDGAGLNNASDMPELMEIYAHEFSHAIDWVRPVDALDADDYPIKGYTISSTTEWLHAYETEIDTGTSPLSNYANWSPSEGFAEFGRLVMLHPNYAKRAFPACWTVWESHGFVNPLGQEDLPSFKEVASGEMAWKK